MAENIFKSTNTTALAFIGDAVYEVSVRDHVMRSGVIRADGLHKAAVKYVRAESQARALKALIEGLTEDETTLVKRARNRRITSKPKNADPVDYKMATAFEALIGALYMDGRSHRMEEIIQLAISAIDSPTA